LHKRPGAGDVRVDAIAEDDLDDASDQIQRAFAARARLSSLERERDLLHEHLALRIDLSLEQELEADDDGIAIAEARIQLREGTSSVVDVAPDVLDVVASLDGRQPLGDVIRTVADRRDLSANGSARLERDSVAAARDLLELGALVFAD
jgi:hypothetical protein